MDTGHSQPGSFRSQDKIAECRSRASFVYYDERKGFVTGSNIGDEALPDGGDLDIIVNVDHARPSTADQSRFLSLEGASLRIDLQQTSPMPSLSERLAWTAIAGFLPENKQLPALKEMTFNPGSTWGKLQTHWRIPIKLFPMIKAVNWIPSRYGANSTH